MVEHSDAPRVDGRVWRGRRADTSATNSGVRMRLGPLIAIVLFVVAGCGAPDPKPRQKQPVHPRQEPSNLTPGVHVSGHVNVGIVKVF